MALRLSVLSRFTMWTGQQGLTAPPRHPLLPGRGLARNRRTRGLRASRPFSSYAVDKAKWPNLTTYDNSYCCYFFPSTSSPRRILHPTRVVTSCL